eukprot:symbB.v1.2.037463.t1/scaffold5542.1/size26012/2
MKLRHSEAETKLREEISIHEQAACPPNPIFASQRKIRCSENPQSAGIFYRKRTSYLLLEETDYAGIPCFTPCSIYPCCPEPAGRHVMATCRFRFLRWSSSSAGSPPVVDRAALEDPLLVAKSLQALARRRSNNTGAWKGHLQRALQVAHKADAQAAARVLNACSRSPLGELATQVAEAYQDRAQRLLPQSSARQLATAANAMARRGKL